MKVFEEKKILLYFISFFKLIEIKIGSFKKYTILTFILFFILYNLFLSDKIKLTAGLLKLTNNNEKFENIASINKHKKFMIIKNSEDEPDTIVKIIVQNKVDYIPKISVVIVYNMKQFLIKCIDTIINQTLKDIEIIIVDNESQDNSNHIIRNYAKKDNRITIIKQENFSLGNARNAGIAAAKGKYIIFLDSNDYFEFNMLEEMYKKISKEKSDIIICQCNSNDIKKGLFNIHFNNNTLRLDLIPKKNTFSVNQIPKKIFQFSEGWVSDKLFRTEFILSNNITFQNISNFIDYQFTFTALCLAKSITIIEKIFIIKGNYNEKLYYEDKSKEHSCFLLSIYKIKSNLEKAGLYNLVKESFLIWVIKIYINQLKYFGNDSKEFLFTYLGIKINSRDYTENYSPPSNEYISFYYNKIQKVFPTINIAYVTNSKYFNYCLTSFISVLKNSLVENINLILLYNGLNQKKLQEINKLKEIRFFTIQTLYVSDDEFKDLQSAQCMKKEEGLNINLLINQLANLPKIDKIIYLSSNTIIRKSLLSIWEINLENKLVATLENLSRKNQYSKINLKHNFYINDAILLINIKEFRKEQKYNKLLDFKANKNKVCQSNQNIINLFDDTKKIKLKTEYHPIEISEINKGGYDNLYLELNKNKDPVIVYFSTKEIKMNIYNNSFIKEFFEYNSILNKLKDIHLTIPIFLSTDNEYAPFMYATMVSILENGYANTFYAFYLLIPSNFSKIIENQIFELINKYKCYINFIYIEKILKNLKKKMSFNSLHSYYIFLAGNLILKEFDKFIYLQFDMCVVKDLSELYNIDMKDNYIAGVVDADFYFTGNKNCKRLNLPSMKQYVNIGMLIINLKQIRKDNMIQKFIELSKRNYLYQDQDIINIACYGKIITLPPKYNAMVSILKENSPILRNIYKEEDIFEANNSPFIINYYGKKKPWNSIDIYMEKYWWDIAKKTPYINILFTRENIYKNELKKFWFNIYKKKLDIEEPRSFNEKIQWLKLYDSTPIKTRLSDKYLVREWIKEKIGDEYLIPLLGVYNKFEDIDFEKLPNRFVIKCNHGSGYNIIVKNKTLLNLTLVKSKVEKWMNVNYAFISGLELNYRDIQRKIIIEQYMEDSTGDLRDYKITCFQGKPEFIWVDSDRHTNHRRNLYDLNWNQLPYKVNLQYSTFPSPKKPECLKKLLQLASILSKNFIYVRVDFYIITNKIYFSEMTFYSASGTEDIIPKNFEKRLASLIKLPKIVYNIDSGKYYKLKK